MWTLGFDTTAATVTTALMRDDTLVAHYSASSATSHSTTLLPAIEDMLSSAGIKVSDISLISCSAGPGSFTGVRIGTATAKGLAAPFGTPCVGVSSLEAMAAVFGEIRGVVCPALNARRGNVYCAFFYSDGNGNVTRLTEDDLLPVAGLAPYAENAVKLCDEEIPSLYVTGDTTEELRASLSECTSFELRRAPAMLTSPSGYGAALAGRKVFLKSGSDAERFSASKLAPIYLRKPQAERELEEKNAQNK